jgi:2-polyprenyl-3-methyl-5-hydroxy-6-metoxy-1,4-benzoquinol methylase
MSKVSILNLIGSRLRHKYRTSVRRLERKFLPTGADKGQGFFDAYPNFFETSTSGYRNRLNKRYRAIIGPNIEIIRDKSILDIASHDGRWSLAASKAGARHILGIEARQHLIDHSFNNMRMYGVPDGKVDFLLGDVFKVINDLEPGRFDTVFCLGFFYHTLYHMELLNQIARLNPKHLILDTCVDVDPDPIVVLQYEGVAHETAGAVSDEGDRTRLLVGHPTCKGLEMMLHSAGFSCRFIDWHRLGIKNWESIREYHEGQRVTVVGEKRQMPVSAPVDQSFENVAVSSRL